MFPELFDLVASPSVLPGLVDCQSDIFVSDLVGLEFVDRTQSHSVGVCAVQ